MTYYHRHLPHWHPPGQDIFLTWRLKGSLPRHVRESSPKSDPGRRFLDFDRALDRADAGPLWLREPGIAESIASAFHKAHNLRWIDLRAYAVMANHIHVLLTPLAPLPRITRLIKGATARQANLILSLSGSPFWQDESFDHWVRNPVDGEKIRKYIERNPVAVGLVARPEDWPWSSASRGIGPK
jgi:REP element-mobilizing transposase RayT